MATPLRIIDAHTHLWDLSVNKYPWMSVKRDYETFAGDLSPVKHSYLLSDLIADTAGLPVEKFIHIQAHMGTEDPSRETAWLQEISSTAGNPRGVIGFAALADPGVETVLANHSRYPVHRGIRQSVNWHSDRFYSMCDRSDYLTDSAWQRGYGLLAKYKMSFELQAFPHQLNDAAALAVRFPDVVMVVEHCGFPIDRSAGGMAHWRSGMRRLVELPNTVVKISALVIMDHEWTAESLRPIIRETVEIFGPSRAMFGSNFPIDKVYIKYPETVKAVAGALDDLTEDELDQVFYRTALKTYRL